MELRLCLTFSLAPSSHYTFVRKKGKFFSSHLNSRKTVSVSYLWLRVHYNSETTTKVREWNAWHFLDSSFTGHSHTPMASDNSFKIHINERFLILAATAAAVATYSNYCTSKLFPSQQRRRGEKLYAKMVHLTVRETQLIAKNKQMHHARVCIHVSLFKHFSLMLNIRNIWTVSDYDILIRLGYTSSCKHLKFITGEQSISE